MENERLTGNNQNSDAVFDQYLQAQYYPLPNFLPQTTSYSAFNHPVDSNSEDSDSLNEPDSHRIAYEMYKEALNAFNRRAQGQNDLENDQEDYLDEDLEEENGFEEEQDYEEDQSQQNPISHQPAFNYEALNAFYYHEQFQQDQENVSYLQQEMSYQQESVGQLMEDAYQQSAIQPQAIYPYFGCVMYPPVNYPYLQTPYFLPLQPPTFDFYSIQ